MWSCAACMYCIALHQCRMCWQTFFCMRLYGPAMQLVTSPALWLFFVPPICLSAAHEHATLACPAEYLLCGHVCVVDTICLHTLSFRSCCGGRL
jgi:hypothetical protein